MTMNKLLLTARLFSLAILILLLIACGGSGGGSSSSPATPIDTGPPDTGVSAPGVAYGPISRFGSIFVNGVEFSTNGASFSRSGGGASESDFRVGDMVSIQGTLNSNGRTGTASSVSYRENVFGGITRVWKNGSMEVLGQTVIGNSFTDLQGIFELEELPLGSIIEVSGISDGMGSILAAHIINRDDQGPAAGSSVFGILQNLNLSAQTFTLGNLTVNYSGANLLDIPGGELSNGLAVQVSSSQTVSGNVLNADVVQGTSVINGNENDRAEVTGIISGVDGSDNFYVDIQLVQVLDTTELVNGTSSNILNGEPVEVEGILDNNGVLIAEKVLFLPSSEMAVSANANAIDQQNSTITVLGTTAIIDNYTILRDDTGADTSPFGLEDINIGDGIELVGYVDSSDNLIAALIERGDPYSDVVIRGTASSADAANDMVIVLGTTIFVTVDTKYEDVNNDPITKAEFFALIEPGVTIVKAEGAATGSSSFTATGIRIK